MRLNKLLDYQSKRYNNTTMPHIPAEPIVKLRLVENMFSSIGKAFGSRTLAVASL